MQIVRVEEAVGRVCITGEGYGDGRLVAAGIAQSH